MSNLYDYEFVCGSKSTSTNSLFPPTADEATAAATISLPLTVGKIEPYKDNPEVVSGSASVFNDSSKMDGSRRARTEQQEETLGSIAVKAARLSKRRLRVHHETSLLQSLPIALR